jgi:hypothetical protein
MQISRFEIFCTAIISGAKNMIMEEEKQTFYLKCDKVMILFGNEAHFDCS